MYDIFFGDKTITFSRTHIPSCDGLLELSNREQYDSVLNLANMLEIVENNKHLCIKTDAPEVALEQFCLNFKLVEAAGGVVQKRAKNGENQLLMIFRNGRWDLPKGHVEGSEAIDAAALREVAEETGLDDLQLGELAGTTLHFYPLDGEWIMKRTWWYFMEPKNEKSEERLTPQTEEGISCVEWIDKEMLSGCLSQSYPSICSLLKSVNIPHISHF